MIVSEDVDGHLTPTGNGHLGPRRLENQVADGKDQTLIVDHDARAFTLGAEYVSSPGSHRYLGAHVYDGVEYIAEFRLALFGGARG